MSEEYGPTFVNQQLSSYMLNNIYTKSANFCNDEQWLVKSFVVNLWQWKNWFAQTNW